MDALFGERSHGVWMNADRSAGHDGMYFSVGLGKPPTSSRCHPFALWEVAVENHGASRISGPGQNRFEPVEHLAAGEDDAVGLLGQRRKLRPGALLDADERTFLEVPHERDAGIAP